MNTMTAKLERLTRLGLFREPDLDPRTDTWRTRVPLGYVDGGDVYEYVKCSPVGGVDPMGLAAWKHTHWWDDSWKQKYRQFVQDHAIDYVTSQEDCASLTLLVLIDFAAQNGLPVTFWNHDGKLFASKSCKWSSKDQFFTRLKGKNGVHSNEIFDKNTTSDLADGQIQGGDVGTMHGHALLVVRAMKDGELSGGQMINANKMVMAKPGIIEWNKDWAYAHPEAHEFIYNPTSTSGIRIDYLNHTGEGKRTQTAEIKYNRLLSELKNDGFHFRSWMSGVFSNYKTWDGTTPLADEAK